MKVGDYVWGPDGHEWKVNAIGGTNKNVLHLERHTYRRARLEDCQISRPREYTKRDLFYDSEQDCGHGLVVQFGKGDWYHISDGSICNKEPEYKGEEINAAK